MSTEAYPSRQELINQVHDLKQQVAAAEQRLARREDAADARRHAELIIDYSPAILFRRLAADDLEGRTMVYVSPNISRFGYSAEDFMTNRIMFRDIVHPDDTERTKREIQAYVRRNVDTYKQVYRIITKDGAARWIEDHTSVVVDPESGVRYHQGIVIDIHRRKEAEDKLRRSEAKYRQIVETTGEGFLMMDPYFTIIDLNRAFGRMTGHSRESLIGRTLPDLMTARHRALLSANPDLLRHSRPYDYEGELDTADGAAVPVLIHGNPLRDEDGTVMGNVAFITDMTEHKKALVLAGEVQKSLLPRTAPQLPGLDIAGKNISCDEIGGDYFDFLVTPGNRDSRCAVVVGDISGHGVASALLMTTARAFLRMRASQPGSVADIVAAMNRHLSRDVLDSGTFMTLFYMAVDPESRSLEWVRAGHDPAWLYDPDSDTFDDLKGAGLALGVDDAHVYRSHRRDSLKKGQVLVVGTDGIWEGHNRAGDMFGKERLRALVRQHARHCAETIVESVFQEHRKFTQDAPAEDDLTLVVVKFV